MTLSHPLEPIRRTTLAAMHRRALAACLSLLLLTSLPGCGGDSDGPAAVDRFDGGRAFSDLRKQVEIGPRPSGSAGSRAEVGLIVSTLRDAGLEPRVQKPWHNVVATIPGSEPGVIVLGAHHDTVNSVPGFLGANDGASGVAVLMEFARSLPSRVEGRSIQLVFFDAEEARNNRDFEVDGTRGSRQYVDYAQRGGLQGSARIAEIKAMVLYDMIGDCDLKIPFESLSDVDLYSTFANAAKELSGSDDAAPFTGTASGVLDDHIPFARAGIPALDLIDFVYGSGPSPGSFWHTAKDDLGHVCPASLDAIGEATVEALPKIGRSGG